MNLESLDARLAGTRFAGHGQLLASVTSTNDALQLLAGEGAPEGTFLIAGEQTAGRGRRGRDWVSRAGDGLYLSVLFRPLDVQPSRWTIAAGIAACDACRESGLETTEIHWPNDLFSGGCKLGGILVETRSTGAAVRDLVVGLGVNVHHDETALRKLGVDGVTSLRAAAGSGMVGGREGVAGVFLARLDALAHVLAVGDWNAVADDWMSRAPQALGSTVRVSPANGTDWEGTADGLATDGALRVRDASGAVHEIRQVDSVRFV